MCDAWIVFGHGPTCAEHLVLAQSQPLKSGASPFCRLVGMPYPLGGDLFQCEAQLDEPTEVPIDIDHRHEIARIREDI